MCLERALPLVLAVTVLCTADAWAQTTPAEARTEAATGKPYAARKWPGTSTVRGTRGAHRVEAAVPMPPGSLVLLLGAKYFSAVDFVVDGDANERNAQHLAFAWQPFELLAIGFSQTTVSNRNSRSQPRTTQSLGDPTVSLKLTHLLNSELGLGAQLMLTLPTSAGGSGVDPSAYIMHGTLLASYLPRPWVELSVNAGYQKDNSAKIFPASRQLTDAQRFTAGISTVDQVVAGVGASTNLSVGRDFVWGPFAELCGGFGQGADSDENPVVASVGVRALPLGKDAVELQIGADLRVAGAPSRTADHLPGVPPWEVYAQLTAHLGNREQVVAGPSALPSGHCLDEGDCASGQQCLDGYCTVIKTEVKEVIKEVQRATPTFLLDGVVTDQTTGEPIGAAVIALSGFEDSMLAVDYKTGKYRSWPIPVSEGLMKVSVSAPGYRPTEQTVSRAGGEERKTLAFKLQSLGEEATGEIKGSLKDSRSGTTVKGEIFIPVLGKKVRTDNDGNFSASIKAGRYQVLISAPKYTTQKKEIEIRAGDVVILNVDLANKR